MLRFDDDSSSGAASRSARRFRMSLYAIGDIQGCHAEFCQLLELIGFSPREDRLWLVGDLVNRGPDSLAVLREVKALGDAAVTVLGNHDFHLLTVAAGHAKPHRQDTIAPILDAPDRDELLALARSAGRSSSSRASGCSCTRACCRSGRRRPRSCSRAKSRRCSRASAPTRSSRALYGDEPRAWRDDLEGFDRLRVVVNACTRLRFCTADGTMEFEEKRGPEAAPDGFRPWFEHEGTRVGRHDDRLRPLVDARAQARAERADARLGLPVGRHADRDQARRSPRVSGAGPRAGARQSRSDSVLGRARELAAVRVARAGSGGSEVQLGDQRALAGHAPERCRRSVVSPTYAGASLCSPVGVAIADRDRLHVARRHRRSAAAASSGTAAASCRRSSCLRERSRRRRRARAPRPCGG